MKRIAVFAGTTEGRRLVEELAGKARVTACVATEYGAALLPAGQPGVDVRAGRMDGGQMEAFLLGGDVELAVDATHPYAVEATGNIRAAAGRAGVPYLRLLRQASAHAQGEYVQSAAQAAGRLAQMAGAALLTTGTKDLAAFVDVPDYADRLYPRVLPTLEAIEACQRLGYRRDHIIAMQGPFTQELNQALLRQIRAQALVTKDGGAAGGFLEKALAAEALGARLVVIGRPAEEDGLGYDQVLDWIRREYL